MQLKYAKNFIHQVVTAGLFIDSVHQTRFAQAGVSGAEPAESFK